MRQALKNSLVLALRIVVSVALIAWILWKVDRRQLLQTIAGLDPWLMSLALAAYAAVNCICAWRWQVLLAGRGIRIGYWRLLRYFLNGLFFGNFLPTTVGGDLLRAYLVADDCEKRSEALASVLVDRFIGLFGVIVTGLAGLVLVARTGQELALLKYMAAGVAATLVLVGCFLSKTLMRRLRGLLRLPLVQRAEHQLVDFYHSLYAYRGHRNEVALAFLQSLLVQLFVVLSAFLISRSIGASIPIVPFFLYMPVIAAVSMIPASINGWGLQEGAFIVFFGRAGMGRPEALTLGFLYHVVAVLISLAGGLLWLVYGGSRRPPREGACDLPAGKTE